MATSTLQRAASTLQPHVGITDSLNRLEGCVDRLQELNLKINGDIQPLNSFEGNGSEKSLSDVLHSTKEIIEMQCDKIIQLVNTIEHTLFN